MDTGPATIIDTVETLEQTPDKILTVDEIQQARDSTYIIVPTPEWGGNLRLASLSAESIELLVEAQRSKDTVDIMLSLLVKSFVDEHGNKSVTDPVRVVQIVASLKRKEVSVIDRLLKAFMELNQIPLPGGVGNITR